MKQRWLIDLRSAHESTRTLDLDARTQAELVTLMATAMASMHRHQANLSQQAQEASTDERTATTAED